LTGFAVVPDAVRAGGSTIGGAAGSFSGRVEGLIAELSGFQGGFGDDTIGMLVGTAYDAVSQWAFECLQDCADDLLDAADDLMVMADSYDEADRDALDRFQGMHGRIA
jgi:hypothetical protein